jgi:hypothetical protein
VKALAALTILGEHDLIQQFIGHRITEAQHNVSFRVAIAHRAGVSVAMPGADVEGFGLSQYFTLHATTSSESTRSSPVHQIGEAPPPATVGATSLALSSNFSYQDILITFIITALRKRPYDRAAREAALAVQPLLVFKIQPRQT